MLLRDPCKKCIVQACCTIPTVLCKEKLKCMKSREKLADAFYRCVLFIITLCQALILGLAAYYGGKLILLCLH